MDNIANQEISEKVISIIVDLLDVEKSAIKLESSFRTDLDADSLDLVELIMAFEEEFGSEITDEESSNINTVGEAIVFIESKKQ